MLIEILIIIFQNEILTSTLYSSYKKKRHSGLPLPNRMEEIRFVFLQKFTHHKKIKRYAHNLIMEMKRKKLSEEYERHEKYKLAPFPSFFALPFVIGESLECTQTQTHTDAHIASSLPQGHITEASSSHPNPVL